MTSARKFAGSRFIKLDDVMDHAPLREQVAVAKTEDGKFGERIVLIFESGRQISLNKTSVGNLMSALGEEIEGWEGQYVKIFAGTVKGPNGTTDAVLVQAADARQVAGPDDEIPF
jgi:hypothetical protein